MRVWGMARDRTAMAKDADGSPGGERRYPGSTDPGAPETDGGPFEDFYQREEDRVRRALCLTLGDADLGSEAADEAFARACEHWPEIGGYESPGGWVYRVAINWARSRQRRFRWRDHRPIPDRAWLQIPDDPDLASALGRLATDRRAVVVCRYYLDWSVEQTAAALDIPVGTVKSRLARALETLKTHLEDRT